MSDLDDLKISIYRQGDECRIVELLDTAFGGWPHRDISCSKDQFWRWKYLDNPSKKNNIVLAWLGERLLGCDHGIYMNLKIGDESLRLSHGTDSAVHPDYHGRGIYTRMAKLKKIVHVEVGRNLSYWISVNPIFIKSALRKGRPSFPYELLNLLRVRDVRLHLVKTKSSYKIWKELGYYLLKGYKALSGFFSRNNSVDGNFTLREIDEFDERIDSFWEEVKGYYCFILERTRGYLNHRFCDPRAGSYRVTIAEDGERILGYSVIMINRIREYMSGNFLDLLVLPGRVDVVDALVKDAINHFDSEGVNAIRAWTLKGHPIIRVLEENGFVVSPSKPPALFFNIHKVGDEWETFQESPVEKIHFQMGDTEWM